MERVKDYLFLHLSVMMPKIYRNLKQFFKRHTAPFL